MDPRMNERSWLVCVWVFCVSMGGIARFILASAIEVWIAGHMVVPAWVFAALDLLPVMVAGVLFLYITTDPHYKELHDG